MPTFIGFNTQDQYKKFTLLDEDLVKRDLLNGLNIRQGQLPGRPQFGTTLWDNLFENQSPELVTAIENEIQRHEYEFNYQNTHINNLAGLKRYTHNYLNYLFKGKLFNNCVVFFELGKNKKYHSHILFQTPVKCREFKRISKNGWLLGHSTTTTIYDQKEILKYVTKELEPQSNQRSKLNLIDNWYIWNDMTPSPAPLSK
jgi:hypothetical protein